jgi:hypothetical protein
VTSLDLSHAILRISSGITPDYLRAVSDCIYGKKRRVSTANSSDTDPYMRSQTALGILFCVPPGWLDVGLPYR